MSSRGRFRTLLALGAILTGLPAIAEEAADGKASGGWTDPPARAAPPAPSTPAASTPARTEERAAPAPVRAERAAGPPASGPDRPAPRSAERRREKIRKDAGRTRAEKQAEMRPQRPARAQPADRRLAAAHAATPRMVARDRLAAPRPHSRRAIYGYAEPEPMTLVHHRRGWSAAEGEMEAWEASLVHDRADRIARARAAGLLIMRSRSYAYPDGTVVRRLSPIDGLDAD